MNTQEYRTSELLRRFVPYYKNHKAVLLTDLFCAALTTMPRKLLHGRCRARHGREDGD